MTSDHRHLFDDLVFRNLIKEISREYYLGFTGHGWPETFTIDYEHLTGRMIDEMGVDNHMEEVLRMTDQKEMTEDAFKSFLEKRKYRGDMSLIEFLQIFSALCIAGKYCQENTVPHINQLVYGGM